MPIPTDGDLLIAIHKNTIVSLVKSNRPDLSARQMAILLIVGLESGPHTVRGLAEQLGVSKPAITRGIDRLEAEGFALRERDRQDLRSVFVQLTDDGRKVVSEIKRTLKLIAASLENASSAQASRKKIAA